ncbi:UbiH 2-polyprenyl-6-methoxyphenol hydroxylase [Pyrenophora tritici-repentis]|uniref:Salicylate hydroxylase n=2 Tax=Pyrenophora tritici-repentis TaxID=45151 RepID=A0A2W1DMF7_9PLEO|nr:monooxygenase [Pyrenophora tritici-repentis Pt-1C-BFP]KAA8617500.1 Salicylate hydroxylase [Pyrenophora tritici-repentis]EDU42405.1 monoxygenase [Pyrenophora tritici-repentis Pt-1C-BFP]KAF7441938.1 Salicylate hydroxylase [Pyrenophora tritici-repentis]KAF7567950.1 UbiH, 2-polyprenyl-6-methoxyphenol hydroxylase and related FAD-dependent oxidoreductase [Pyrenophora tritici-repentis]KAG9376768.1 Salicylate hydroxylase [Pyrenophora tritici-repentis]
MAENTRIAIVGAGMGGLAAALSLAKAGHKNITIYENAPGMGFVGAGIQLAPNMARILDRLDCWGPIRDEAVQCANTSIREGSTDKELGYVDLAYVQQKYGYPHMVGHRASLANGLYEGCKKESGITFKLGSNISDVQFGARPTFKVTPIPVNGEPYQVECDVLLGADGVKSSTRVAMLKELGHTGSARDSGQAAYRIMLNRDQMEKDPELLKLIDSDTVTRWIGEKKHIIAYPIHNKQIYNISTAQPDTSFAGAPDAQYTTKGSKKAMLKVYEDFCPMIHRMLDLVPEGEVVEWKLRVHDPLITWVHGTSALVGDACHPTLPHMAQGAAQAIEDGAVLGVVLAPKRIADGKPETIERALRLYERLRKPRAEALVELAAESGRAMHLGTGKAKEERDKIFAALKSGSGKVPDKWADADVQAQVYGVDVVAEAEVLCQKEGLGAKL